MPENQNRVELAELRDRYLGAELVESLSSPTPEGYIWDKPGRGGGRLKYIPGHYFIKKLNECFGFLWSFEVGETVLDGNQVIRKGKLSVVIPSAERITEYPDGTKVTEKRERILIIKEQEGRCEIKRWSRTVQKDGRVLYKPGDYLDLGNDYKGAGTDALKKCATMFGIGADVYGAGEGGRERLEEKTISSSQVNAIFTRGEKAGLGRDEVNKYITENYGRPVEELEQQAFLEITSAFQKLEREKKP